MDTGAVVSLKEVPSSLLCGVKQVLHHVPQVKKVVTYLPNYAGTGQCEPEPE